MRYIRQNTNLRMPEVLQVDETFKNSIRAPFMIMAVAEGREASAVRFGNNGLTRSARKQETKHNTLATGMSELRHLEFDKMGTLHFSGGLPMSLGERISKLTVGPCDNRNFGWLPDRTNHKDNAITYPYSTSAGSP